MISNPLTEVASQDRQPERVRTRWITAVTLSILLPAASIAYFGSLSGFVFDDFRNFRDAQLEGLSLHYLLRPVGDVYFSPGHRIGNWVIQRFFPMNFWASHTFAVATFAISLGVLYLILRELSRRRLHTVVLTSLYGFSVIHVAVAQWWTSALQIFPATLLSFVCIYCYIRFRRTGRSALLGLSVGTLSLALLFHSKPAYVPLYLVLIRVLLLEPEKDIRQTITAAVREWRIWLAYLVPVIVFMAVFLSKYTGGEPSLESLMEYLSLLWVRVLVPGLFGAYIPQGSMSIPELTATVAAHLALVGAAVWTIWRIPGAWRAWTMFVVVFLVNAVPIGLTRIAPTVVSTAETAAYGLRYNVEITYMSVVALAFLFSRREPTPALHDRLRWRFVSGIAVAGYVVLALLGARQHSGPGWIGRQAAHYVDNFREGLRRVSYSPTTTAFADGPVPEYVVFSVLSPANTLSEVLPVVRDDAVFDIAGRDLLRVGDDGAVQPVAFHSQEGGDYRDLLQQGLLVLGTPTAAPGEKGLCLSSGNSSALVVFTPRTPVGEADLHVALRYSSRSRRPIALGVEPIGGSGPGPYTAMMLKDDGEQTNLFPVEGRTLMRLYIGLVPDSDLCLKRLEVGHLSARP